MLQRLIKDPFALALALTVPCLLFVWRSSRATIGVREIPGEWRTRFLFTSDTDYINEEYNYAALAIIWTVAIIRWKWQKEDKAQQTGK